MLDQRPEVAVHELDQPVVAHSREQAGQAQLGDGHDLAPPLEARQRVQHRPHLALGRGHARRRVHGRAEADRYGEAGTPLLH